MIQNNQEFRVGDRVMVREDLINCGWLSRDYLGKVGIVVDTAFTHNYGIRFDALHRSCNIVALHSYSLISVLDRETMFDDAE